MSLLACGVEIRWMMRGWLVVIAILFVALLLWAQVIGAQGVSGVAAQVQINLVRDIFPGPVSSYPAHLVEQRGLLYFTAVDPDHGVELWSSDGAGGGARMIKDVQPGEGDRRPEFPDLFDLTPSSDLLYFTATGNAIGLWRSDGAEAGTFALKEAGVSNGPGSLAAVGNTLFFVAADEQFGQELWKTTGTPETTTLVRDIVAGPDSANISDLTAVNGTLLFTADSRRLLWRSDGTQDGTVQILDGLLQGAITPLASSGTLFFFQLYTMSPPPSHYEVWRSDGTEAGTFALYNLDEQYLTAHQATGFNGQLHFFAKAPGRTELVLWKSDGTPAGTAPLNRDDPTALPAGVELTVAGNHFYYYTRNANFDITIWRSNGSLLGTQPIAVISGDESIAITQFTEYHGRVYFFTPHYDEQMDLWTTDGTVAGTTLLRTFSGEHLPDNDGLKAAPKMKVVGDLLLFAANDGVVGTELWGLTSPFDLSQSSIFLPIVQQ